MLELSGSAQSSKKFSPVWTSRLLTLLRKVLDADDELFSSNKEILSFLIVFCGVTFSIAVSSKLTKSLVVLDKTVVSLSTCEVLLFILSSVTLVIWFSTKAASSLSSWGCTSNCWIASLSVKSSFWIILSDWTSILSSDKFVFSWLLVVSPNEFSDSEMVAFEASSRSLFIALSSDTSIFCFSSELLSFRIELFKVDWISVDWFISVVSLAKETVGQEINPIPKNIAPIMKEAAPPPPFFFLIAYLNFFSLLW